MSAPTKKKRYCCVCKKAHPGTPHCPCKTMVAPRLPPPPITQKPKPGQVREYYHLDEVAFFAWKALKQYGLGPFTIKQVVGALRCKRLYDDRTVFNSDIKGCVVRRQQTMVHKIELPDIISYMKEKYG